jgi:hypothetical protein
MTVLFHFINLIIFLFNGAYIIWKQNCIDYFITIPNLISNLFLTFIIYYFVNKKNYVKKLFFHIIHIFIVLFLLWIVFIIIYLFIKCSDKLNYFDTQIIFIFCLTTYFLLFIWFQNLFSKNSLRNFVSILPQYNFHLNNQIQRDNLLFSNNSI